jgi:hypothetical protein
MIFNDPTLNEYRKAVEWYAQRKADNMLHNKGNDHALVIFENLFRYSERHVRIFAKDLANVEVVNRKEYIKAVKEFIDKPGVKLDILITSFNDEVKKIRRDINLFYFLRKSKAYEEGRIKIKTTKGMIFRIQGQPIHFCTSDGHAYRMERDIENRVAHCNFGDKKTTKTLEETFDRAFSQCVNNIDLGRYFDCSLC